MQALIDQLRRMTAVGAAQYEIDSRAYWTDDDLEGILTDRVSARLYQAEVELISSISAESRLVFLNGRVSFPGKLDTSTATVVSFVGQPIAGATIGDSGAITFATSQATTLPLLSGTAYDLNGAAADVLTDWASAVKLGYDIEAEGEKLTRSQRHSQLLEQAKTFSSKAVISTVSLTRSDVRASGKNRRFVKAVTESFEKWGLNA